MKGFAQFIGWCRQESPWYYSQQWEGQCFAHAWSWLSGVLDAQPDATAYAFALEDGDVLIGVAKATGIGGWVRKVSEFR